MICVYGRVVGAGSTAGEGITVCGSHMAKRRLKVDDAWEINVVYFANVSGAVLRPHNIVY